MRSAMPLFTDHLQLPLFTGQRRWHTMFGQLNQLTSSSRADTAVLNVDEDILADSNFASFFDSSPHREWHPHHISHDSCMTAQSFHTVEATDELSLIENDFPALDENADSMQSAAEQFVPSSNRSNNDSPLASVTNIEPSCGLAVSPLAQNGCSSHEYVGRCAGGSQVRTLHGRRHSDPGSIHSGTTGSLSANSSADNWYYYDRRLRPGGVLAAQYGRLRIQRSLSMIVSPPAYDDVCYAPVSNTFDQCTSDAVSEQLLTVSEPPCENVAELPPPYQQSELPPSYSEVNDIVELNEQRDSVPVVSPLPTHWDYSQLCCAQNWPAGDGVATTRCSNSHALFTGRPAVRWNRNTSVERWTSSFNWVMS